MLFARLKIAFVNVRWIFLIKIDLVT